MLDQSEEGPPGGVTRVWGERRRFLRSRRPCRKKSFWSHEGTFGPARAGTGPAGGKNCRLRDGDRQASVDDSALLDPVRLTGRTSTRSNTYSEGGKPRSSRASTRGRTREQSMRKASRTHRIRWSSAAGQRGSRASLPARGGPGGLPGSAPGRSCSRSRVAGLAGRAGRDGQKPSLTPRTEPVIGGRPRQLRRTRKTFFWRTADDHGRRSELPCRWLARALCGLTASPEAIRGGRARSISNKVVSSRPGAATTGRAVRRSARSQGTPPADPRRFRWSDRRAAGGGAPPRLSSRSWARLRT